MGFGTIRRATGRDSAELTALVQHSGAYRGEYASIIIGYEVTAAYIERHQVFLAEDDVGRVLGFYSLILAPPELDLAFVADEAQGKGVGRQLIEHMTDQARSAGLTQVDVVSHPPSAAFYRRMGAEPIGTVEPSPPEVSWPRPKLRFTIEGSAFSDG